MIIRTGRVKCVFVFVVGFGLYSWLMGWLGGRTSDHLLGLSQNDIDAACLGEDSDFQPVLKPYQMVGVNFLLLLYRKGIGGGNLSCLLSLLFCYVSAFRIPSFEAIVYVFILLFKSVS